MKLPDMAFQARSPNLRAVDTGAVDRVGEVYRQRQEAARSVTGSLQKTLQENEDLREREAEAEAGVRTKTTTMRIKARVEELDKEFADLPLDRDPDEYDDRLEEVLQEEIDRGSSNVNDRVARRLGDPLSMVREESRLYGAAYKQRLVDTRTRHFLTLEANAAENEVYENQDRDFYEDSHETVVSKLATTPGLTPEQQSALVTERTSTMALAYGKGLLAGNTYAHLGKLEEFLESDEAKNRLTPSHYQSLQAAAKSAHGALHAQSKIALNEAMADALNDVQSGYTPNFQTPRALLNEFVKGASTPAHWEYVEKTRTRLDALEGMGTFVAEMPTMSTEAIAEKVEEFRERAAGVGGTLYDAYTYEAAHRASLNMEKLRREDAAGAAVKYDPTSKEAYKAFEKSLAALVTGGGSVQDVQANLVNYQATVGAYFETIGHTGPYNAAALLPKDSQAGAFLQQLIHNPGSPQIKSSQLELLATALGPDVLTHIGNQISSGGDERAGSYIAYAGHGLTRYTAEAMDGEQVTQGPPKKNFRNTMMSLLPGIDLNDAEENAVELAYNIYKSRANKKGDPTNFLGAHADETLVKEIVDELFPVAKGYSKSAQPTITYVARDPNTGIGTPVSPEEFDLRAASFTGPSVPPGYENINDYWDEIANAHPYANDGGVRAPINLRNPRFRNKVVLVPTPANGVYSVHVKGFSGTDDIMNDVLSGPNGEIITVDMNKTVRMDAKGSFWNPQGQIMGRGGAGLIWD